MLDLHIWHASGPADLTPIKAAKARLEYERDHLDGWRDLPDKIRPVAVASSSDLPNYLETRVLAVGSRPPFLCEYALVTERTSPEGYVRALCWVLGISRIDEKATTILDTMTAIFGPGTREVTTEELEARKRLRDYQQARV